MTEAPPHIGLADLTAAMPFGTDEPRSSVLVSASEPTKFLLFALSGAAWCIAAEAVREVVQPQPCPPIPGMPPHIRGVAALRGEVITVIDLAALLGVAARTTRGGRSKLVVLRAADQQVTLAFEVEDVIAAVDLSTREFGPSARPYVDGELQTRSGDVYRRIDVAALHRLLERS